VSPSDATALEFVANPDSDTSDDRVYTVENAVADAEHQLVLVKAADVTVTGDTVTFVEDGTLNEAALNLAAADITVVNGVPSTDGATASITPTTGSFTFRVDGHSDETIIPVVYFDDDEDGDLDLDADDAPTEPFGIGGAINYQPAEAAAGTLTNDEIISEVDKDANQIVTDGPFVYNYDANDIYYVFDGIAGDDVTPATPLAAANQVTMADFEAELSVGDELAGLAGPSTDYRTNPDFSSTFVLEDITPLALTGLSVDAADTSAVVTVDTASVATGATVNAKVVADNGVVTDAAVAMASVTEDADDGTAEFQVNITGLTAPTNYEVFVWQTVGGEDSAPVTDALGTTETVVAATIDSLVLTTDVILSPQASTGDVVTATFSKVTAWTDPVNIQLTDAEGDVFVVQLKVTPAGDPADGFTDAGFSSVMSGTQEVITVTLLEDAEDRNLAGDGDITWPATINAISGLTTTNVSGPAINLAGSADVVVN
jgi:hypothetical protein